MTTILALSSDALGNAVEANIAYEAPRPIFARLVAVQAMRKTSDTK